MPYLHPEEEEGNHKQTALDCCKLALFDDVMERGEADRVLGGVSLILLILLATTDEVVVGCCFVRSSLINADLAA